MKNMGEGSKKYGKRKKLPKNFPPCGCEIDFYGKGGGNNMIPLHNIYAWKKSKNKGNNRENICYCHALPLRQ